MLTSRQAIKAELLEGPLTALELSQRLSLPEKEVLDHLSHIARAPGQDHHLEITPSVCKHCGFTFKKRQRLTTPSRCPICKQESIRRPRFALVAKK
jgi:predicted Zn-ribbon and HTH transcriptional regulator